MRSHILTNRHGAPLMVARGEGLLVEVGDGMTYAYRGSLFYRLTKVAVIQLAEAMARDLDGRLGQGHRVTALAGWLRSEAMLDGFGATEANWRDHLRKEPGFAHSEPPYFAGHAVAALAADPDVRTKACRGRALSSRDHAEEYGFHDVDGSRPNWRRRWAATRGGEPI